jgi:hypothetical protein
MRQPYNWSDWTQHHERRWIAAICSGNRRRLNALDAVHVVAGIGSFSRAARAIDNGLVRRKIIAGIRARVDFGDSTYWRRGSPVRFFKRLQALRRDSGPAVRAERRQCYMALADIALDIAERADRMLTP